MCFHGYLNGIALQDLSEIKERAEIFRFAMFCKHISFYQLVGMLSPTLMGHHHFGSNIPVFGTRCIAFHRFKIGERLKAILAEKTASFLIILRNWFPSTPYSPLMAVPVTVVVYLSFESER